MKFILTLIVLGLLLSASFTAYAFDIPTDKYDALKADFVSNYGLVVYTFGPNGDQSIPYLLQYVNDPDKNVRLNAIMMLGSSLLAREAKEPLIQHFGIETDPSVKLAILRSLEGLIYLPNERVQFFSSVVAGETNAVVKQFAQETLNLEDSFKATITSVKNAKEINPNQFNTEYQKFYTSYGTDGDLQNLLKYSTIEMESDLKKLKEHLLTRQSQTEITLQVYKDINDVIIMNRMIAGLK